MATTTNYGWTTPDDTALVKDGAAAIRTLGSSVDTTTKALNPSTTLGDIEYRSATANTNTRLPIGTTGQVLAVVGGVPAWATTADQTPLTTKGDIFTFTTVDARLGVGANGTVLTADSAEATGLKWATPSGGGKVLQVVQGTTTTRVNISSTTYTDSGLSATITPTSATSKILVLVSQYARTYRGNTEAGGRVKLLRGATDIWNAPTAESYALFVGAGGTSGIQLTGFQSYNYLDSPATTSATTYKTQWRVEVTTNSSEVSLQVSDNMSTITLLEIGA